MDGEHLPSVVRAAISHLSGHLPGAEAIGAALVGGGEKLVGPNHPDLGLPLVGGPTPEAALAAGLARFAPDLVYDLSDVPVVDSRRRMGLAARALAAGVTYAGADFRFDPPLRPRLATKASVAVVSTDKRAGKTAVTAHLARLLAARGTPPVVVTMGRGGPLMPEVVDPAVADLTPTGLLCMADAGRHAASDHLEDALMAGVATVGTSRCGAGLVGAPADDGFAAGVAVANERPETILLYEGSGSALPPAHADATILVVPATADPELVTGYLGSYRVLLSDLIVVTMAEPTFAVSGAVGTAEHAVSGWKDRFRGLATGAGVVRTTLRPFPLQPISGRRVFYVTAAPAHAMRDMVGHLEHEHGCKVVGMSSHLASRHQLAADLDRLDTADVLVVELKAAAVDTATRIALERGIDVVYCDNRVVAIGDGPSFDELALATADLAMERFQGSAIS
ncbi:MAG: 2,3-diphosphoglycerate synthetase [Acidimicrobiales bacterium]